MEAGVLLKPEWILEQMKKFEQDQAWKLEKEREWKLELEQGQKLEPGQV